MKITKEELSWALYDFANSAFATVVMAGFFPIFFKAQFDVSIPKQISTFYLGLGNSIISLIVALLFPFLGYISDRKNNKKFFLSFFAIAGIIFTSLLYVINKNWQLALIFYVISSIGFFGSNVFYDAFLNQICEGERRDFISSLGYSLGYLGGGLLFLITIIIYQKPEIFMIKDREIALKFSFILVGIWWFIFSIPLILFLKEKNFLEYKKESFFSFLKKPENKRIIIFLLAYWFYIDGVDTIIKMSVDYGISLGFSGSSLILALLMVQFVGFPFALLYSFLAKFIKTKNAIILAIIGYMLITIFGMLMKNEFHFFILAFMVAVFQGGIQALSRSYFSSMIAENESGKFFGIYNMVGKFATISGPFLVGIFTLIFKNHRVGISSIIFLFIIGAILFIFSAKEVKNA